MGMALRPISKASVVIRCFADQGSDRAHGQGGLRTARLFAIKAQNIATERVPPKITALNI